MRVCFYFARLGSIALFAASALAQEPAPSGQTVRPEVGKPINVRFGDELLARVDVAAAERGKSRADTLRELVAQALGA